MSLCPAKNKERARNVTVEHRDEPNLLLTMTRQPIYQLIQSTSNSSQTTKAWGRVQPST